MSKEANPHFRVNVYGDDPNRMTRRLEDMERSRSGNSGGLPWFGNGGSPTYPTSQGTTYTNPSPVEPYEDVGPQLPDGGAGGAAGGLIGGMTMAQLIQMLAAAGVLGAGALGGSGNGSGSGSGNPMTDAALQEALALQSGRMKKSEPLYDAILQMAGGLMPTQYQPRPSAGGAPPVNPSMPPPVPDDERYPPQR